MERGASVGRKTRGKNYPRQLKERAYQLVSKDGYSYRDVAKILNISDCSIIYRFCQQIARDTSASTWKEKKIDSGVPVPHRKPTRYYLRLAFKMNEGDSVYFETPAEGRRMYRALRDMGYFGRTSSEGRGLRVWKLKEPRD